MSEQIEPADPDVPDEALASALEFVVLVAAAGTKLRPPLAFPAGLRPFVKTQRVPATGRGTVRAAVEADTAFRKRAAKLATADLLDEVGVLWLTRPEGWVERIAELRRATADQAGDLTVALRAEQRRREAAEKAAVRARTQLDAVADSVAAEREQRAELSRKLTAASADATAARRRIAELESALAKAERRALAADGRAAEAVAARDAALAALAADQPAPAVPDLGPVRTLLEQALAAVDLAAAADERRPAAARPARRSTGTRAPSRRVPIAVPPGRLADEPEVAEHFLRTAGVQVFLDGYNVAKLGWPTLDLAHQREMAVDTAEGVARRWGTAVTVVFDGADVVGSSTTARRLVKVVYSPAGVTADDVLRSAVDQLDVATPVVVVTNDQAIVRDVAAVGANVVRSEVFLAVARR